jgi:O-methyltransferase
MVFKKIVNSALGLLDLEVRRKVEKPGAPFPVELSRDEKELFRYVRGNGLTMVSDERLFATMLACKHIVECGIDGAFVECGVWRGGNAVLAAGVFKLYGAPRKVYLFDTFAGMTMPSQLDIEAHSGEAARGRYLSSQTESHNAWCYASVSDVEDAFRKAGLLDSHIVFVQGDVLSTLSVPENLPASIAVLRLDTDWYASTRMELETLYPRLSIGGVLMIDDYGYWTGSRKATDEFFARTPRPFLQYIDETGRAGVKVSRGT